MIVVGGYVGKDISCDSPGIYVFDTSGLKWENQFKALSGGNTQSQQASQSKNNTGLSGSYGYQVPAAVQSVIGVTLAAVLPSLLPPRQPRWVPWPRANL